MYLAEDAPGVCYNYTPPRKLDHHVPNQSTLLNAALRCKTFLQPALDALWWSIDDIANLFLLLPAFKESEDGTYVKLTLSIPDDLFSV